MVEMAAEKQTQVIFSIVRFISGYALGMLVPFIYVIIAGIVYALPPEETTIFETNNFYLIYCLLFFVLSYSLISFLMELKPKYFYLNFFILFSNIIPLFLLVIYLIEGNTDVVQTTEEIRKNEWESFLTLSLYGAIVSAIGMLNPILLIKNWKNRQQ